MTPRQKLLAKIKALLEKTVVNGCTEGEAMSALAKARELMDEYEVTDTDLTFGGEEAQVDTQPKPDREEIRARLCLAVGAFCGCQGFKNGFERIAYVGFYADTTFAHWLLDTLEEFVKRELRNYLDRVPSRHRVRRTETRGFVYGCADRIAQRLYELTAERRKGSTELTVKKNELVTTALRNAGIILRGRFRIRTVDKQAENAGIAAGDHATFDKPIEDSELDKIIISYREDTDAGPSY